MDVIEGKRPLDDNIENESNKAKKSRVNLEINVELIKNDEYYQFFKTGLPIIFIHGCMIFFESRNKNKGIKGVVLQEATVEEITEEQYNALVASTKLITSIDEANIGLDDDCATGACPVR